MTNAILFPTKIVVIYCPEWREKRPAIYEKSGLRLFSISSFSLFDEIKAISIPEKKANKNRCQNHIAIRSITAFVFVSIHSQTHCHQRDRIQSFKLSTNQIRRSVPWRNWVGLSRQLPLHLQSILYAYFLSHKNTGNFNTLEIKGVFTGYFSIEAKTIDTFPRFSLCNKKADSKFNHFDV